MIDSLEYEQICHSGWILAFTGLTGNTFPRTALIDLSSPVGFSGSSDGKESTCNAQDLGLIHGSGRSPEKGMATHSSILAWRMPWTEELDGLQSMGSQRVRHDWAINISLTSLCSQKSKCGGAGFSVQNFSRLTSGLWPGLWYSTEAEKIFHACWLLAGFIFLKL